MPFCEECKNPIAAPYLQTDVATNKVVCADCRTPEIVAVQPTFLGREVDYNLSYNKKGLEASIRVGGAKLSLSVDQAEITRVFGPEK